jgi:heme A synthase
MDQRRFPPFAWGVFGYSLLVILWGYFLRISESGDGCGTDWPLCRGAVVPAEAGFSTLVELTHRVSSGVVLVVVAAMAIWAFRAYPRGHLVRTGAAFALLFTVSESLFGAMLVVFGWVATDVSTARILVRPFHVTNTFLLMAALAVTPFWAALAPRGPVASGGGGLGPGTPFRILFPGLVGILALGWTGAWTGLAATAFPAESLSEGVGQYLDPEHLLIQLRLIHPVLAVLVVVVLVRAAARLRAAHPDRLVGRLAAAIGAFALLQLAVGPFTVLMMNPVWSRLLHLFLADLLWVAAVLACAWGVAVGGSSEGGRPAAAPREEGSPAAL